MTIGELMKRIAGDDLEWSGVDQKMLTDMAGSEIQMGTLAGIDRLDGRPYIFRVPFECLRERQ